MMNKYFYLLVACTLFAACSDGSTTGVITSVNALVVDSTNDRVFLSQENQEMFVLEASTLDDIGDQPVVGEDTDADTQELLPDVVTQMAAYVTGTTTRLFIMGALADDTGNLVLNRVRVLDFDGTEFSENAMSPITLSDGDATTDESDDNFAAMLVDQDNGYVFITDTSTGALYVLDVDDGTTVTGPIAIAGRPQGMSLDEGHLYVCNSSSVDAEQVITVVAVSDFSTTAIDVDASCLVVAAKSNDNGTALFFKHATDPLVGVYAVDTTTYAAATQLTTDEEGFAVGSLTSGIGISSEIEDIIIVRDSAGALYGYLSELDGNLEMITISSDVTQYDFTEISTTVEYLSHSAALVDSSGNASDVLIGSEIGSLLTTPVGSDEDFDVKN